LSEGIRAIPLPGKARLRVRQSRLNVVRSVGLDLARTQGEADSRDCGGEKCGVTQHAPQHHAAIKRDVGWMLRSQNAKLAYRFVCDTHASKPNCNRMTHLVAPMLGVDSCVVAGGSQMHGGRG
jgi:hypothetical protein